MGIATKVKRMTSDGYMMVGKVAGKVKENLKAVTSYLSAKKNTKNRLMKNTQSMMDMAGFSQDNDNPENMGVKRYTKAYNTIYKKYDKGDTLGAENYIKEQKEKIRKQRYSE